MQEDEAFLQQLYVSTRQREAAAWGWGEQEAYAFLTMQFQIQQRAYQMQYPDAEHVLLVQERQPIGRMLIWREPGVIRLVDISILPEYRGQGIGSDLLRSLFKEAEAACSVVQLHVLQGNPAIRLYERLGFRMVEVGEVYNRMEWCGVQEKDDEGV